MVLGPSDPARPSDESHVWPGHDTTLYETPMFAVGRSGANLQDALDQLEPTELSRMVNVVSRYGSPLQVRAGQAGVGTTQGGYLHRLFRLNDPQDSSFARLAGLGTTLFRGTTGAFTLIDSGYSADPLTFTGVTMPRGNEPYVFVSDRIRMRKVTRTGVVEEIGIPPGILSTVVVNAQLQKTICHFDAADSSAAVSWTYTAGTDRAGNASGTPTGVDVLGAGDLLVQVSTVVGAAVGGYSSIISLPRSLDLDYFSGLNRITDDDLFHFRINVSRPDYLEEIKVYFVTSAPFTPGAVPGASVNNTEAFYKSFRPNDFTLYHTGAQSGLDVSEDARTRLELEQFKEDAAIPEDRTAVLGGIVDLAREQTPQFPAGRNVWGEWGVIGIPLRRGDFARVGNPETTDSSWNTVRGLVIVIQTAVAQPITITFSDWDAEGGSGPDVSEPGFKNYDYRVRNIHSRTGSKGNPSPVQVESAWVAPLRQSVTLTPAAAGVALMRQQAFRRGGGAATTQDWFFVGENTADGGTILDTQADDAVVTEETLEIDNDQPVTSTDPFGGTQLHQIVPVFFRVEGYVFALGDPNQPGRLYRSKLDEPESWPATDYKDVSPSGDPLQNGGAWTTGGFVFSRQRLYRILIAADGEWTVEPTECAEGLVTRWAMAVTPYGIAFVSPFGVRLTQGGAPTPISDEDLGRSFRGETLNAFLPPDFTVQQAPQLEYADDELWLTYADTGGTRRQWIYAFKEQTWRNYLFGEQVGTVYTEPVAGQPGSILLGGSGTGQVYTHSGFSDDGAGIAYTARTGAWDFGQPRNEKTFTAVVLDADLQGSDVTVQTFLNTEVVTNNPQALTGATGERRYLFEPFGSTPQHARNISVEIRGTAPTSARPYFNRLGVTQRIEPEIILREPTPWEELPGGEGYVWGCFLTCDTGGEDRTVVVETTVNNGPVTTVATLIVNANGRKKLPFTWASVLAQQIRLRATGECEPWLRYKIEWFADPEPPRVVGWDSNWQDFGTQADKWLKGYLLEADTFGQPKVVVVDLDQTLQVDIRTLTFPGRGVQHISFPKQRFRLARMRSVDSTLALLPSKFYRWQPIFDEEPLALARWETQERPFEGMAGRWQKPLEAFVTLRSTALVNWTLTSYGMAGAALNSSSYNIPSTGGGKSKVRVPLNAAKGLLFAHLFTSSGNPLYIYREESEVLVEDWETGQAKWVALYPSNDDLDPGRTMGDARSRAQTPDRG